MFRLLRIVKSEFRRSIYHYGASNNSQSPTNQPPCLYAALVRKDRPYLYYKREKYMARVSRSENERLVIAWNMKDKTASYPTAGECAKKFGVPQPQWSAWINGRRSPEDERLEQIAKFCGCTVEDLKTEPPNWDEEKTKMIEYLSRKKGGDKATTASAQENREADDAAEGADDYYVKIVSSLAKVQTKFNKGQISKAQYDASMKSINEFIDFSYRDVLP